MGDLDCLSDGWRDSGNSPGCIADSSAVWYDESDKSEFLRGNSVLNRSKEACHCKNVTYGMIEDAIRNGADTLQQVMDVTGAGKGCGKCKDFLEYLIRDIKDEKGSL